MYRVALTNFGWTKAHGLTLVEAVRVSLATAFESVVLDEQGGMHLSRTVFGGARPMSTEGRLALEVVRTEQKAAQGRVL